MLSRRGVPIIKVSTLQHTVGSKLSKVQVILQYS